jgi:beta-lactamase regulating signal transducer with metallopeptidase domain
MHALFSPLPSLLKTSGQASILILLVLAAQWCCGRRLQPRWRCALWLLVLLRLALPWTAPCRASLFNILQLSVAPRAPQARLQAASTATLDTPDLNAGARAGAVSSRGIHWLVWLWAAGALSLAGSAAANHYRIQRRVARRRSMTDGPTLGLLEDCKALMGVATPVTLIEMEAIQSPTLFGFVRPRLLLPAGLASRFTREELSHVFLHELAHIKRQDVLIGWVMTGLLAVHWFNPLVWLAFHRLRADREMASDALALARAGAGENESYGLTIVKLLEGFSQSAWGPSLAGILENKQQMKERITMIAKFRKTNQGLALAVSLFSVLALVTLTDAQSSGGTGSPTEPAQKTAEAKTTASGGKWDFQQKLTQADAGNQSAAYDLWDAYYRGNHGVQPDVTQADKWLGQFVQHAWVVRFEPVDDFAPANPGEFLERVNRYGSTFSGRTNLGLGSFFRTTKQGNRLVASFLTSDPDELKARLAKVPGVKFTSVEPLTPQDFIKYEQSPQESLQADTGAAGKRWNLEERVKAAQAGDQWAVYDLWDTYHRGKHGVQPDPAQADKWLQAFVKGAWVVRFEPFDDFAPTNPRDFLQRVNQYASTYSGHTDLGLGSFFRTTKQDGKLVGSFLTSQPDELKARLAKVPGLKVVSWERLVPEDFIKYEQSPQESL